MPEIWVKRSWSLRGADFDLRRFLIVYNKAPGMALRLSTHHCCSYPPLSTDDGITGTQACMDSGLSYEERIWYEGQASENHLEDAQGSAQGFELLEPSVAVKPGFAVCSYDETSWIESLNVFLKPLFMEEWMLWIDNEAYNEAVRGWRRSWGLPEDMEIYPREPSYETPSSLVCHYE